MEANVLIWNQVKKRSVRITGSSGVKLVLVLEGLLLRLRVSRNWAFRSWLNGSPAGGGAEVGAQAGERKKYWRWERKSYWYWLELLEALWITLYWSEEQRRQWARAGMRVKTREPLLLIGAPQQGLVWERHCHQSKFLGLVQHAHCCRAWPVRGFDKGYYKPKVRPLYKRNRKLDKVTKSPTKSFLLLLPNGLADLLGLELLEL